MTTSSNAGTASANASNYNFGIKAVFGEGWERTKGFKGTFLAAMVCMIIIVGLGYFITGDISNMIEGPANSAEAGGGFRPLQAILELIINVFLATPLSAGLWMMVIKRSVDRPVTFKEVFQYFSQWKNLWAYPVLFSVLGWISTLTMNVPLLPLVCTLVTLAFAVTFFMFVPLVVEKKLGTMAAFDMSRKAITPHWFKMLWFVVLTILIIFVSLLTAGIAFIWTLPWMYCAMGVLYRTMFGVTAAAT